MLLSAINICFAQCSAGDRTTNRNLHSLRRVEIYQMENLALVDAIRRAEIISIDSICSLNLSVSFEILEDNIEGQFIWTRILASDNRSDIYLLMFCHNFFLP